MVKVAIVYHPFLERKGSMRALVLLGVLSLLPPALRAEGTATVVVGQVAGEVEVTPAGASDSHVLQPGEKIQEQDRVYTGFDSKVELQFSDGTVVVVQELTDMKVASFRTDEGKAKTRIWLRAGELDAHVKPATKGSNDFHIKTPTTTCSVRGTNPVVCTALGMTSVSFVTGHGQVGDDASGTATDTSAPDGAANDPGGGGLESSSDQARSNSQGGGGVNGLTRAETSTSASLFGGDTTIARGDVGGAAGGTGTSIQTFSDDAMVTALLPPATPATTGAPATPPVPAPQTLISRNTQLQIIDSGDLFRVFTFDPGALNGRPNVIQDVNVSVTFSKASAIAGSPRFDNIQMQLSNPDGVTVQLVALNTFLPGNNPAVSTTISFDQDAANQLGTTNFDLPVTGSFRPVGNLDDFDGRTVAGNWGLIVANTDSTGAGVSEPLRYEGAVLEVTH